MNRMHDSQRIEKYARGQIDETLAGQKTMMIRFFVGPIAISPPSRSISGNQIKKRDWFQPSCLFAHPATALSFANRVSANGSISGLPLALDCHLLSCGFH